MFQPVYPDLENMSVNEQVAEMKNAFLRLSREVEYAISHIDSKNITKSLPDQITKLTTVSVMRDKLNTASYVFDENAFNVYGAGIKIWSGTPESQGEALFYADNNGTLNIKKLIIRNFTGNRVLWTGEDEYGQGARTDLLQMCWADVPYGHTYINSETKRWLFGGGDQFGNNDNGIALTSYYTRPTLVSGLLTDDQKKAESGLSFKGDVVIHNLGDGYYRPPVVSDANYKYRIELDSNGNLYVFKHNVKTNALVETRGFQHI